MQNPHHDFIDALFTDDYFSAEISPIDRLSIYRNNIRANLVSVLADTYPLIKKLVGADCFEGLAVQYIKKYPSRQSALQYYGAYLHEFLREFTPVSALAYLPEIAKFEFACHELYFAADHPGFDRHQWKTIPFEQHEQILLELHPASALIAFSYPILDIIALCEGEITELNLDDKKGLNLLIYRPEFEIKLYCLSNSEFAFLTAIQRGDNLKKALMCALQKEVTFPLTEKLALWIDKHIIVNAHCSKAGSEAKLGT